MCDLLLCRGVGSVVGTRATQYRGGILSRQCIYLKGKKASHKKGRDRHDGQFYVVKHSKPGEPANDEGSSWAFCRLNVDPNQTGMLAFLRMA